MLLEHFERIFDTPESVEKLEELILDMAIRGKLVQQDPNDEPASELLEQIGKEKERLIEEKKIKREKPLLISIDAERPYELPQGWEWIRLGEVVFLKSGNTIAKEDEEITGNLPYLKVRDMGLNENNPSIITSTRYINDIDKYSKHIIPERSIIFPKRGGAIATNRKRLVLNGILVDSNVMAIIVPNKLSLNYIYQWFNTIDLWSLNSGTSVPQINNKDIAPLMLPVPPFNEQKRIVEKITQLRNFCGELKKRLESKYRREERLNLSSFSFVEKSVSEDELQESLQFVISNLQTLCTETNHVKQLRKTILSLAVRGKLVPQDFNNEPASVLLEKVKVEKEHLIQEKKIKKEKSLPPISDEEKPFEIPKEWEWVRFSEIIDVRDGTHDTPKYIEEGGYPLVTGKDFYTGELNFTKTKYISKQDYLKIIQRSNVDKGDILFSMIGGNIGSMVLIKEDLEIAIKNVALFKRYTEKSFFPEYLMSYLRSVLDYIKSQSKGGAQPFVSLTLLRKLPFALPPLNEQKRIVEKVNQLMELCDELEQKIEQSKQESENLMKAVLQEAFTVKDEVLN
ncbi:restriction endonuclease subunit S [Peribacillus frigoritolerans]|uniref:restriction endonuclease subunit S n=1 Tax=Peribacillus frigoritolerans TaxID=450367 RepID=UPI002B24BF78|nr:restriction endonuclease subunit S [Peribacillus frigoritolerans]MEB2630670.1 restriction endonuclease subunit S [Peribacillus frigoritolerans]